VYLPKWNDAQTTSILDINDEELKRYSWSGLKLMVSGKTEIESENRFDAFQLKVLEFFLKDKGIAFTQYSDNKYVDFFDTKIPINYFRLHLPAPYKHTIGSKEEFKLLRAWYECGCDFDINKYPVHNQQVPRYVPPNIQNIWNETGDFYKNEYRHTIGSKEAIILLRNWYECEGDFDINKYPLHDQSPYRYVPPNIHVSQNIQNLWNKTGDFYKNNDGTPDKYLLDLYIFPSARQYMRPVLTPEQKQVITTWMDKNNLFYCTVPTSTHGRVFEVYSGERIYTWEDFVVLKRNYEKYYFIDTKTNQRTRIQGLLAFGTLFVIFLLVCLSYFIPPYQLP
jgi:hypothetical protein